MLTETSESQVRTLKRKICFYQPVSYKT